METKTGEPTAVRALCYACEAAFKSDRNTLASHCRTKAHQENFPVYKERCRQVSQNWMVSVPAPSQDIPAAPVLQWSSEIPSGQPTGVGVSNPLDGRPFSDASASQYLEPGAFYNQAQPAAGPSSFPGAYSA